jgi:diguanylate cyclase (GGDEF)-like protein
MAERARVIDTPRGARAFAGRLRSVVGPEALVFAAALGLGHWSAAERSLADFVRLFPYVVAAAATLLAWRLQRSRLVFAVACLALAHEGLGRLGSPAAAQAVAVLLPLDLAAIALAAERGVASRAGLVAWALLLCQVVVVGLVAHGAVPGLATAASYAPFARTPLGVAALAAFGVAIAALATGRLMAPSVTARGYLWALAAALLAVHAGAPGFARSLYFAAAGCVLAVAVVEHSYVLAFHDGLTGLPGRRALQEALARLDGRYAIAMVDVDHFKRFNDEYGHDVGDQVLRVVGTRLAESAAGGRAFRYGGEEFTLLFPGRSVAECLPVLEEARKAIADNPFTVRGRLRRLKKPRKQRSGQRRRRRMTITVSIGVAERSQRHGEPELVIQAADRALYRAKSGGRNRVEG